MSVRMLDIYCCQGGASAGYKAAGFTPYGIDLDPQPRYPYPFHQGDAIEALITLTQGGVLDFMHPDGRSEWLGLADFSAAHGSPPCQAFTRAQKIMNRDHPQLVGPTRDLFETSGLPYVIENVEGAPLIDPFVLCGTMFGIETYRHRLFETNWGVVDDGWARHQPHVARTTKMGRAPVPGEYMHVVGNFSGVERARGVMGMPWANRDGLREAIPPAYTEFIGQQLAAHIREKAAA